MADNSFGIKELNLVGSGTPKIQSPNNINLEAVTVAISTNATVGGTLNVGGVITGDGSGLTGVVGSGSGIAIKHDGSIVGTAGTIDFSTNLDVSAISGAAVTITASSGGIGTDGSINTTGIITASQFHATDKITVGSGATIEANGQASFTGIITSKSSILVEGGSTIVDIGSGNQGFYLYNGASTHLAISWSSSASRNQFRGDAGGSHPLWFEDFSDIQVLAPLIVSSNNDFKVGSGVTIQSSGGANFVGVITAGSLNTTGTISCGSDLDLSGGTIRRDAKLWLLAGAGNPEYYAGTPSGSAGDHIFKTFLGGSSYEKFRIGADGDIGILQDYGTSGQVLTSNGAGSAASWTTVSGGIGTNGSVNTTGIITAAQFSGVGNDIVTARWTLGANGTSDFTFTGPGFPTTQNDPVIYLARGQTYEFENNSGGSHPFQIQDSEDTPYTTGVTYPNGGASATSGITTFAVPFTASNSLQYKCTSHSSMGNTIVIYPNLNV